MESPLTEDVLNGSPSLKIPSETINKEIAEFLDSLESQPKFNPNIKFDPNEHILYKDEDYDTFRKLTLQDLGIHKTHVPRVSDLAVTDPFPLFTKEACDMMKWESFQLKCLDKYGRLPKLARGFTSLDFQICGYINHAPFTKAAWTHPRTQEILNNIAGINLKIMFDYEIAHINASLINKDFPVGQKMGEEADMATIYDWHYDSNSFVIVLMLSTNDDMIGGKTGLIDGNERVISISEPKVGYACLLQGRVVRHVATKPVTNHERISSVVGYIPESVEITDTTVLTSFKPSVLPRSIHDEYYPAWCEYRFSRLEEMLKHKKEQLKRKEGHFDQKDVIAFCKQLEDYVLKTYNEFELYDNPPYPPKIYSTPYNDL
ncbi:hypothetical protein PSN45_004214 [Yamadazyma tenuis]|uniref:Fe2OG dioxygenase domain-containing protein n=1 Tax=Candida tenuis (strain ATCC 10573 / BCRC 21748 / CBS 615 / JCM 9827 / NBRC 10315 / NRRL Y-1498 / VKM Y-70) TaxID=590646 RepID=G3B3S2_CANTC|nr:uncharacterized protein CANTEDRAFT_130139 [Yamadazyma tenuis ATCC 10573]EGV63717.1 hypothetical protein CANTEDRAFT_130139 [Yamadazyma tenuis ATCC 10573]WEJ96672.1 hypothetical protein PSN45_004214 [Yamadazyma tenuis]